VVEIAVGAEKEDALELREVVVVGGGNDLGFALVAGTSG
jgi:hypothetical protein